LFFAEIAAVTRRAGLIDLSPGPIGSAMTNGYIQDAGRFLATTTVIVVTATAHVALGQGWMPSNIASGLIPAMAAQPAEPAPFPANRQPMNSPSGGPLARLIENPDQTSGAPPFALTDQTGTIQRYVEPVDGVDLSCHVGQVVVVRHDTGSTLLASQLELPPAPLRPMVASPEENRNAMRGDEATTPRVADSRGEVQQAQYVDGDDSSVQLLPDDLSMSGGMASGSMMPLQGMESMDPGGQYPVYADQMMPGMPMYNQPMYGQPYQPMYGPPGPGQMGPGFIGPQPMMGYPNQMMGQPCPNCGQYHNGMSQGCGQCCDPPPGRAQISGDVELMLLRPNITENAIGKVSEDYQFSPRFTIGLRGAGNLDGRVRYWHYDRNSDLLGTDDDIRIRFDVLDVEGLHRFAWHRSELTLAAGLRLAGITLEDATDEEASADLMGLTLAAGGATHLVCFKGGHFGLVYGGRLSILGGDWGADDNSQFIDGRTRNDNVLVHELYGGIEIAKRIQALNVHARLLWEMQNWHSDALAEDAADIQSIGVLGPGLQLGAEF
jgi:hypothetical protein